MQIQENISLAPFTTLAIGGPARFFARATTAEDVAAAVRFADERRLSLFVLGGGSNLVVSDHGWNGLVLQIALDGIATHEDRGRTLLDAGAGVFWDEFVALAVSQNLAGVECLSGIPGTVGGTPVQNVGAYGQEVSQTIVSLSAFDIARAETRELSAADCGFSYRCEASCESTMIRYFPQSAAKSASWKPPISTGESTS
jgi:UDP-N-acetylmuramate dehydrogenase